MPDSGIKTGTAREQKEGVNLTKRSIRKTIKRCQLQSCRKKLTLSAVPCRCGLTFCSYHRLPECHSCCVDYKTLNHGDFIKKAGLEGCYTKKLEVI